MLDVDGVLVNGRPQDGRSWAADIERDLGIAPERLQAVFFAPHWGDVVVGRKDLVEVLRGCLPALSAAVSVDAFLDYWFQRDAAVDAAVLADCDALRANGVRVVLATNQEHLRARYLMERLGLGAHVDGIVYSAAVAARKPQQAFFEAAAAMTGSKPRDLVLVDDTAANIDAAIGAGWAGVRWSPGSSLLALLERGAHL
ncbi:HAD family hydrolase [Acuticoccus mangrovi]|uniref:HAD-IA family hydrolase n=1 Tax=Acuticoccus mangrovi TaxID=2796142 RepID=A0A934MER5_9HYPH|nr:HAD-IA family hydrolase [Acuticoccus mangrovi]MBJ3774658.1 HAD-IA family hydrolase [Acuticoccus mangrovi]